MPDTDCVAFLQWALPRLNLRWPGFRKVRGQVCKRLKRRMSDLGLDSFAAYRERLKADPQEWRVLDDCCHITISRFYRDRGVFATLLSQVLPDIAFRAWAEDRAARCWSAGCASGEEPYTLKILWDLHVSAAVPGASLAIVATDVDEAVLRRARTGCFKKASLRELPPDVIAQAFDQQQGLYCVRPHHRQGLAFLRQDLRTEWPDGPFDLILCRNLAFTYFAPPLQERVLERILERLAPRGYLVIGAHERLPVPLAGLAPLPGAPEILRRQDQPGDSAPAISPRQAR